MASIYDLKPRFQALLRPLCRALAEAGVTANQVTVAAMVLSLVDGGAIFFSHGARWALLALPPVLLLRMALNALDGMLAREFGQKSRLGAVLNELGDVVSDTALYLPFAVIPGMDALLVAAVVILAVMTEMAGVVAVQIGAPRQYEGPFGKSDRALYFSLLAILLAIDLSLAPRVTFILWCWAAMGAGTIFFRIHSALRAPAP